MPKGRNEPRDQHKLVHTLKANWLREREGARTYRSLAQSEADAGRREILLKLSEAEEQHAAKWAKQLAVLGEPLPVEPKGLLDSLQRLILRLSGTESALRRIEANEVRDAAGYGKQMEVLPEGEARDLLKRVRVQEKAHSSVIRSLLADAGPNHTLAALLRRERWHVGTGTWIGDAIYGANDGLGASFGIVSGMAGYSGGGHVVVVAGVAGLLASALSMGSGAYLAAKSEREIADAELARERAEIEDDPEEERQELELFYRLSGLTQEEAGLLSTRVASRPDQFLKTLAHHELGLSEAHFPNPGLAALSAASSTALGALVPVIPFLFAEGAPAILASAIISTLAHFGVGAAKTIITGRSWLIGGLEMTGVGILEAGVTFLIGLFLSPAA